jgi:SAM-dependent methyltransferase
VPDFTCNICGKKSGWTGERLERERPSCLSCGSTVRTRGLIHALSLEIFGVSLTLPDFPQVKSLRGLGTSDPPEYAETLAAKFDYRNTFYDRAPRLDITQPPDAESELYDFVISSEVFEHTPPPAENAFRGAARLLNECGVLLMTVPYQIDAPQNEHFPEMHECGLVKIGKGTVLVNRTADGRTQVFDNLVFHRGVGEPALEMREFSEEGLRSLLAQAGFCEVRLYGEDYLPFGIAHAETWSLPIAARKAPFRFTREAAGEIVEQWRETRQRADAEMRRLNQSLWLRVGRKLGLL